MMAVIGIEKFIKRVDLVSSVTDIRAWLNASKSNSRDDLLVWYMTICNSTG